MAETPVRSASAMAQLGFASIFTLAALACVAVSFSTDYWVVTTVNRNQARADALAPAELMMPYAFTRNRGLFRTCYEGNDTLCECLLVAIRVPVCEVVVIAQLPGVKVPEYWL